MNGRARQIYLTGAEYTFTSWPTSAIPRMYDQRNRQYYAAQRGTYRCDTFVLDIFGFTNTPNGQYWMWQTGVNFPVERVVTNDPQSWKTNINLLFTSTAVSPATIYNRIKTF